jgi:hypothetical protein
MEILDVALGIGHGLDLMKDATVGSWNLVKLGTEETLNVTLKTAEFTKNVWDRLFTIMGREPPAEEKLKKLGQGGRMPGQVVMDYQDSGERVSDFWQGPRLDRHFSKKMDLGDDVFDDYSKDLERRFTQLNVM